MSDEKRYGDYGRAEWSYQPEVSNGYHQGTVRVDLSGYESQADITPAQAREMAADLLAAADDAEAVGFEAPLQGPPRPPSDMERMVMEMFGDLAGKVSFRYGKIND